MKKNTMKITSALAGELSNVEVEDFLNDTLERYKDHKPKGIRVSNSIFQRGFNDKYRDIPIAMAPSMYPHDQVEIEFFEVSGKPE